MNSRALKDMRINRGLTRRDVATELCVTEQTIYALETNENSNPTSVILKRLAEFYGCTTDHLLGRDTPTTNEPHTLRTLGREQ